MRRLAYQDVVEQLGSRIVCGELGPGAQLPTELSLSEQHGVSRVVVREALQLLTQKRLIQVRPRTGARVLPRQQWRRLDPDVMAWSMSGPPDLRLLRELTEVRRVIEPGVARLAATRATDADREELASAFRAMAAAAEHDREAFIAADLRFHGALLIGCGNELLLDLTHAIDAGLRSSRDVTVRGGHTAVAVHERVLGAVLARQPDAAEAAMAALIEEVARDIELELASRPA